MCDNKTCGCTCSGLDEDIRKVDSRVDNLGDEVETIHERLTERIELACCPDRLGITALKDEFSDLRDDVDKLKKQFELVNDVATDAKSIAMDKSMAITNDFTELYNREDELRDKVEKLEADMVQVRNFQELNDATVKAIKEDAVKVDCKDCESGCREQIKVLQTEMALQRDTVKDCLAATIELTAVMKDLRKTLKGIESETVSQGTWISRVERQVKTLQESHV